MANTDAYPPHPEQTSVFTCAQVSYDTIAVQPCFDGAFPDQHGSVLVLDARSSWPDSSPSRVTIAFTEQEAIAFGNLILKTVIDSRRHATARIFKQIERPKIGYPDENDGNDPPSLCD